MKRRHSPRFPLHILVVYVVVSGIWILSSDLLLDRFVSASHHAALSIAKGWFFIAVTGSLLAFMLHRYHRTRTLLEKRITEIIDHLPSVLYAFDQEGKAVLLNRAMTDLLGVELDGCAGKSREELRLSPETAAQHRANDLRIIETGRSMMLEETNLQADGLHTYLTVKFPLTGSDGSIEAVCGVSTDITEQKKAEAEFRESQECMNILIEHAPAALAMFDREMRYLAVSRRWMSDYCLGDAEILGRSHYEVFPEIPDHWKDSYRRALDGEVVRYQEDRFERMDGSIHWLRREVRPWHLVDGSVGGVVIFTEDITERKLAEDALRENHERLKKVLAVETVGVMFWDLTTGCLVDANDTFLELMGYSRGEMEARELSWQKLTPPEYIEVSRAEVRKFLSTGRVGPYEKEYLRKDGTRNWFVFAGSSLGDNACVEFCVDISDRKKAEAALRVTQEKLLLAQRVAGIGTFEWDMRTNVNTWSPELEVLYGLPVGGFNGTYQGWRQLVHPEDLPEAERHIRESLETGSFEAEWRVVWPDGSVHWLQGRATVLRDDAGEPERLIGANFDITSRKEVEERISQLNASLEQRIRERTARLEEVNRELEAFSYSVSHDLKAPLRGIDGYSQLLENDFSDRLDDEGRLFIRNIRASSALMHQLIEDLLSYSRMERRQLESIPLELQRLVRSVAAERTDEIDKAGIEMLVDVPPLTVRADRDGLAVVLRNLLENALKFSRDASPPVVEIGGREEDGKAILWVRDNGIGFDMKFHDRIFEIFQRLQRIEDYPGTGIGLALVRKAMQRMGGRAWAESAPGEGATFFLEIPL